MLRGCLPLRLPDQRDFASLETPLPPSRGGKYTNMVRLAERDGSFIYTGGRIRIWAERKYQYLPVEVLIRIKKKNIVESIWNARQTCKYGLAGVFNSAVARENGFNPDWQRVQPDAIQKEDPPELTSGGSCFIRR